MAVLGGESDIGGGRGQSVVSVAFLLAGILLGALGEATQYQVAGLVRGTVLRPFLALQEGLARARTRASDVDLLMTRVDSLSAILTTQSVLEEENETLRQLLDLRDRLGPGFRSAITLRPGTAGSESMFLLDVGREDGIEVGSPVIGPDGLVGVVRDVGPRSAVGMDWTHPEFRASGMVPGADVYGIVENRRGAFREEDRLVLTGTAYNEVVLDGSPVVTSGLGGIYPRGIPIGTIDGVADYQGDWRKSYWLRPRVLTGAVTHVLVLTTGRPEGEIVWPVRGETEPTDGTGSAPESESSPAQVGPGPVARPDSIAGGG